MLTTEISQEVLDSKLCKEEKKRKKKKKRKENDHIILGNLPFLKKIGMFSRATCPHTHTYPGQFSWATCPSTQSGLFSGATSPHTYAYPSLFSRATCPSRKRKSGLIVMGDLSR